MTLPLRTLPDPRDLALQLAPGRMKGALVSLLAALHEVLDSPDDAVSLIDEVATVLEYRLSRDEIGVFLIALASAAHPSDLNALADAVNPPGQSFSPTGARPSPEPIRRHRSRSLTSEERRRAEAIPCFDLPDAEFNAWLWIEAAPLIERKRLFYRLWRSFDPETRRAFQRRMLKDGDLAGFLEMARRTA